MIKNFCKRENFQSVTDIGNKSLIKFSKKAILTPVYEGEGEERNPTGEYVDSGLVSFVEEYIYGDVTPKAVLNIRLLEVDKYGNPNTAEHHKEALRQLTTIEDLLAYDIHSTED